MPRKVTKARKPSPRPDPRRRGNAKSAQHQATGRERRRPSPAGVDERIAERRLRALSLRKAGHSYRAIATALNADLHTVHADVQAEIVEVQRLTEQVADAVRSLELQRCDDMTLGLWPAATGGDPRAVAAAMRVAERRSRLLGLDMPQRLQHDVTHQDEWLTPDEVRRVSDEELAESKAHFDALKAHVAALKDIAQRVRARFAEEKR